MFGIIRSLFVIIAAVAVIGGGTYSYFSATGTTAPGILSAGTLTVDILKQNEASNFVFPAVSLVPGEETKVNFDVKNGGTANIPVNLRGLANGAWANTGFGGVDDIVKVSKVERWDSTVGPSGSWVTLSSTDPVTGIFYYSPTGADTDLFAIPAGDKAQFQLTVKLDNTAGNMYQGKAYNASITVQTKQVLAPWETI